ncbi:MULTISPECIES: CBS domain-containing protein [Streptomyces]|uniref:CBS domain-containing protein n=1 Tax=Streptomyces TaxID=1883 RepID=UPI00017F0D4C|nr:MULTISPECIES: CBS domain-containing protein [Streptomyces]AKL69533.1 CBS domain protein [Streptomyces sp. Mg1]RPK32152.1 Inosine-5'-monophosphate dehydrogenase [Streptomyces sp. ADI91-18]WBY18268.1 CBS domain-containing protein [Streptomyces goshikiensis]WSS02827.1 CBS domain-containing protein [Streptomyces goshikiensis]WSX95949.1 CBS domain-containing protein [Streptomyces goshikiensis]
MKHIKVADLMTDEVVSVAPDTAFKDVAKLLAQYGVSGLPVLDDEDRVVGVVSQTDVLAHAAPAPHPAEETARPTGSPTAGDVMSTPAVTVHAEETAADAARLMTRRGIERLPVVDEEDRLVGIVTRRDLLRLFVRPDSEIRRRVTDEVLTEVLGVPTGDVDVHVVDGCVTLDGRIERRSQLPALLSLIEQLEGVVAVASHVRARTDDTLATHAGRARDAQAW